MVYTWMLQTQTDPSYIRTCHHSYRINLNEGIELSVVSTESFVTLGSRFAGVKPSPLHPMAHYESFMLCPFILEISQPAYYFLCWLLTGYTSFKGVWHNDLLSLSEVFLKEPRLWVLWWMARTKDVCTTFGRQCNAYGWVQTACDWGLAIILPHKGTIQYLATTGKLQTTGDLGDWRKMVNNINMILGKWGLRMSNEMKWNATTGEIKVNIFIL